MSVRSHGPAVASHDLETRCARFLARTAKSLAWEPAESQRWRLRLEAARTPSAGETRRLGRQLFQLAPRLRTGAARAEARRLAALFRLAHDVARAADAEAAFGAALTAVRDGIEFETATGFRLDPGTQRLTPAGVFGGYVDLAADFQFDHGAGVSSWVVKSRRPILLSALRRDGDGPATERIASFLCVPVLAGDSVLGVLCLGHRRAGALAAPDRDLLLLAGRLLAERLVAARCAGEETALPRLEPEERLLAQRVGEEARASHGRGAGFTLIGLSWPDLERPGAALRVPSDLRHRVAEWAKQTGGREASAYPLGGSAVVLLLPRTTPQATRRLALQLRESFQREWGSVLPPLNLATVLYPRDAETGQAALQRLRDLLGTPEPLPAAELAPTALLRPLEPPAAGELVP